MLRNNVEYAQLIKRHRAKTSLIAAMIGNFLWEYKLLYFLKILPAGRRGFPSFRMFGHNLLVISVFQENIGQRFRLPI